MVFLGVARAVSMVLWFFNTVGALMFGVVAEAVAVVTVAVAKVF